MTVKGHMNNQARWDIAIADKVGPETPEEEYERDAAKLYRILTDNLPSGTWDRLRDKFKEGKLVY
jgi:hypothetical protein